MSDEARITEQRRRTRSEVAQIVAQFADSGLNRTEFCRHHGISWETLNRHLKRMQLASTSRTGDGLVAVELVGSGLVNDHKYHGELVVVLSRDRRIEVRAGFDAATLQRLVALLENM